MPSYSTLIRAARRAKNPIKARTLRKQANEQRRVERLQAAAGHAIAETSRLLGKSLRDGKNMAGVPGIQTTPEWRLANEQNANKTFTHEMPGQGEIVGAQAGEQGKSPMRLAIESRIAEIIAKAKKGDDSAVGTHLRAIFVEGKVDGRKVASDLYRVRELMNEARHQQDVVCGFITKTHFVADRAKAADPNGAAILSLPLHEAVRVMHALEKAGWTYRSAPEQPATRGD